MTLAAAAGVGDPTVATSRGARISHRIRVHGTTVGLALLLGYLILFPLVRLQILALEDGGRAYREAWALSGIGKTILTTVQLGVGSLIISLTLGTMLAWFALRLPQRWRWLSSVPVLPIVLPAVAVLLIFAAFYTFRRREIEQALRDRTNRDQLDGDGPRWGHFKRGPEFRFDRPLTMKDNAGGVDILRFGRE
jgi:hypothetical protein